MASSYVEVRESENGTEGSMLQFEIDPCESNGIDIPPQSEGEPPKDHTYNKAPEVHEEGDNHELVQDEEVSETKEENNEAVRKSNRNPRNAKSKVAKARASGKQKPVVKREASKRAATRKQAKEEEENVKDDKDKEDTKNTEPTNEAIAEDKEPETPIETPGSPKKRSRKRKAVGSPSGEISAKQIKVEEPLAEALQISTKEAVLEEENEAERPAEAEEPNKEADLQKGKNPKEKSPKPAKEVKGKKKNSKKAKEAPKISQPKTAGERKLKDVGEPDASLPPGWTRKLVERKSGKTAGLIDIYIYSPDGIKFRSRPDIAAYLARVKSSLRVEDFSFTKRGIASPAAKPAEKPKPASKSSVKLAPKSTAKPKKPLRMGSNSPAKKGQKLVVKLSTPKKRPAPNSVAISQAGKKSKPMASKALARKVAGGSRRVK